MKPLLEESPQTQRTKSFPCDPNVYYSHIFLNNNDNINNSIQEDTQVSIQEMKVYTISNKHQCKYTRQENNYEHAIRNKTTKILGYYMHLHKGKKEREETYNGTSHKGLGR